MRKNYTVTITTFFIIAAAFLTLLSGCLKRNGVLVPEVRSSLLQLAITEINYKPADSLGTNGDKFEFVEIKDTGLADVDLTDVQFNDGINFEFPAATVIKADSFIVLAANAKEFTNHYGFAPFGAYSGSLSNSGEKISMEDKRANIKFLSITYSTASPWPQAADGEGYSLVPKLLHMTGDPNDASYWRASSKKNGSPGKDDPAMGVLVNEALTHTDLPQIDAVELYNPNNTAVDIGGWYLTDSKDDPVKFKIPVGTKIDPLGYKVFTANDFNANPALKTNFAFSEHGEQVYLFSDSTGIHGAYYHGFSFGQIENGVSFGRYVNSVGEEDFVAQTAVTLGKENAGPRIGPLVFSEIMYNPKNGQDEFIEVTNISANEVALYDTAFPNNTWKIKGGIDFKFPKNVTIKSNEKIVIISDTLTESQFRTTYGIGAEIKIFLFANHLSNSSDTVSIEKPDEPYIDSTEATMPTVVPYILIEKIGYSDSSPWPDADGNGASLNRIELGKYGNDPVNWKATTPSPGQ
jgi:hypothetical protein